MRLIGKQKLEKYKRKKRGERTLTENIDRLIADIESSSCKDPIELKGVRPDADCVHSDGFYYFNIDQDRTMIMIEFDDQEATVVWVGNHKEYTSIFKNNKNSVRKWLKKNSWI